MEEDDVSSWILLDLQCISVSLYRQRLLCTIVDLPLPDVLAAASSVQEVDIAAACGCAGVVTRKHLAMVNHWYSWRTCQLEIHD